MMDPFFFGYGSLVNRNTHAYGRIQPAKLTGWRRVWRQISHTPRPILTVEPSPDVTIEGLIAHVPDGDWQALDAREAEYDRIIVDESIDYDATQTVSVSCYTIPDNKFPKSHPPRPIYLSYLDVVVQGYLREFGQAGVRQFFETTVGWEAPIYDDRSEPIYPRHQILSQSELRLVDRELSRIKRLTAQM